MPVSKRVRFEVLRRDDHTCQYCGAKAPTVKLTVDHVTPVALGGSDKPNNLVAACADCNSGKTSIAPDAPFVEAVSEKAAAYALAMQDHMTRFRASLESLVDYEAEFEAEWEQWKSTATGEPVPLPPDYKASLYRWQRLGIPVEVFAIAIPKAMLKDKIRGEFGNFSYMAGVINNMVKLDDIDIGVTVETAAVYTAGEAENDRIDGYEHGVRYGKRWAWTLAHDNDPLSLHIDRAVRHGT